MKSPFKISEWRRIRQFEWTQRIGLKCAIIFIQIKKNGLVVTFVSSFCALYMFTMQLVMLIRNLRLHHIINEYTDLIFEITLKT